MTSRNVATPFPHTFNGEDYDYWSSRFEVWLKAFDLWNIIDKGFIEPEDEDTLSDAEKKVFVINQKKDTHALNQINLAIDKRVYEKILKATTSKQAWEILQKAYKDKRFEEYDFGGSTKHSESPRRAKISEGVVIQALTEEEEIFNNTIKIIAMKTKVLSLKEEEEMVDIKEVEGMVILNLEHLSFHLGYQYQNQIKLYALLVDVHIAHHGNPTL
ncbi:hypothetical protein ZIOFF_070447 [Zingiber officinale]|uniref:DUF4219 domain-containing protein n=1 Tax=Zingiber officinale TaxID=94328 RepID=A0A8J5CEM8_ZINOF|nr:hypothetical protein ZIOFF_070447 [Zingiber officinale]